VVHEEESVAGDVVGLLPVLDGDDRALGRARIGTEDNAAIEAAAASVVPVLLARALWAGSSNSSRAERPESLKSWWS
jgi:hypothetical protein